jgi:hypothetical protein
MLRLILVPSAARSLHQSAAPSPHASGRPSIRFLLHQLVYACVLEMLCMTMTLLQLTGLLPISCTIMCLFFCSMQPPQNSIGSASSTHPCTCHVLGAWLLVFPWSCSLEHGKYDHCVKRRHETADSDDSSVYETCEMNAAWNNLRVFVDDLNSFNPASEGSLAELVAQHLLDERKIGCFWSS